MASPLLSPLQGRKLMVTGGSGFLGRRLVAKLHRLVGAAPVIADLPEWDLTDAVRTAELFASTRPDVVFHLAARVGGIGANRRHPGSFFRDNMAMGLNVLEQARRSATAKVVVVGTVCAYPKLTPVPFREEDLWNGYPEETNAPYGIAKKALLVMAQSYRQEFGSNFVTVLPVNLYGPGDNFDLEDSHVVPSMIRKFVEAKRSGESRVVLWGDGSPTREFLYVDDAADALIATAERYDEPEPLNIGAGFEISMRELAATIADAVGYSAEVAWDTSKPNGQPRRRLDVSRARERLGFEAATPMAVGLARTIEWYLEHREAIFEAERQRRR